MSAFESVSKLDPHFDIGSDGAHPASPQTMEISLHALDHCLSLVHGTSVDLFAQAPALGVTEALRVFKLAWRDHRPTMVALLGKVLDAGRLRSQRGEMPILMPHTLLDSLSDIIQSSTCSMGTSTLRPLVSVLQRCIEVVCLPQKDCVAMALRAAPHTIDHVLLHTQGPGLDRLNVTQYLQLKEKLAGMFREVPFETVSLNLAPFNANFPMMTNAKSIGQGVQFLNRHLTSRFFASIQGRDGRGAEQLVDWLRSLRHRYHDHCQRFGRGACGAGGYLPVSDEPGLHLPPSAASTGDDRLLDPERIRTVKDLERALAGVEPALEGLEDEVSYCEVAGELSRLGLRCGWGKDVGRIKEMTAMLQDILQGPDADTLERFLSRVPNIVNVVVLSPHGFFGQSNVLGLPDTGGQVVYLLDAVRALEAEMRQRLEDSGRDPSTIKILIVTRLIPEARGTSCDQRLEAVNGTSLTSILRVPFRDSSGRVIPHWISRFDIWPYLERFALDVEREILAEMGGKPDLIIGNYSDGNLVATLLCKQLAVCQCNIAHALEKTKYTDADTNWQSYEDKYHFSCQITADLISACHADFVVTSTYQEICGNEASLSQPPLSSHSLYKSKKQQRGGLDEADRHTLQLGQYESFQNFTLPGIFRVIEGINVFDPKFNIISPGSDPMVYFPYHEEAKRLVGLHPSIQALLYGEAREGESVGCIQDKSKPLIFAMARLDKVKNLTGLAEWYGRSPELQSLANLVIVGGVVDPESTTDREEREECLKMHSVMSQYSLHGSMRWLIAQTDKIKNGELYRCIADTRGVFVQPALFEAFGLTVVEAMSSGLPTFATNRGGPSEIIKHGKSGFQIDPYHGDSAAALLVAFFNSCKADPSRWDIISQGGLERIRSRYTWSIYAARMMTLTRVYSFWRHVTNLERQESKEYLDVLYKLLLRPMMARSGPPDI